MGILNITPDSFFDGGKYNDEESIVLQVEKMLTEGATFIDVGAYSSRPGAKALTEAEELSRIIPIVTLLIDHFPDILLSIDTFRSRVAENCLAAGAAMINDITAGTKDDNMLALIANYKVPYIMMHMRGTPQTMKQHTVYENLLTDILYFFSERMAAAKALGICDIIIDPGFGFAKTLDQNYELLQHLDLFQTFNCPVLVGLSRKSMIYKALGTDPSRALNGTTALNTFALNNGANILRVHDVAEAMECIRLMRYLI
tara:strand:+ start:3479 stop:4249 length:771 start_codon:yes stop_codon:yes gene_type:complete